MLALAYSALAELGDDLEMQKRRADHDADRLRVVWWRVAADSTVRGPLLVH